ncbi:unnamed protein product [Ceratitis capitata]|uniref:(Mediterranean fruit fly) hypothetical protein n=1 Tax=Ceratitis capitata TaxID=7213 RepID=A0A811UF53_CERCA|nr:unnamed protein product [Ceratitis capitata]
MAQRNNARIDRFAQMTKQEEIIAKKRQEILEKQRTAQLAKAVAAAQSLAAKLKSDVNEAETSGGDTAIGVDNKSVESSSSIANADSVIPNELAAAIDKSDACVKGKKEDCSESAIAKPLNSLTGKTGKISFGLKRLHTQVPVAEQPPPKVVNSFCNDGSFLENFKKILEKHEPKPTQTTLTPELKADDLATEPASVTQANESAAEEDSQKQNETSVELNQGQLPMGQTAAPSVPPISQSGIQQTLQHPIMTSMSQPSMPHHQHPHQLQQSMAPSPQQHMRAFPPPQPAQHPSLSSLQPQVQPPIQHQVQQANILPPTQPPFLFNHHPPQPPPVPPPHPMSAAFFAAAPPPPPPPQLPMTLALGPLYMIPAPEPLQLNTIPAPKEFDLNAIPKPQMNVEAIQMPHGVQQSHQQVLQVQQQIQQQQQQQQQQHQHLQLQQQQQKTEQLLQMQQIHNTLEDSVKPPPPPPHLPRQLQQLQSQLPPKLQHTQQLNQQTPPPPPPPQPQQQQQRQEEQEQQQADREDENSDQSPVFSDNNDHSCSSIQLPTTVEHLIELVGENGDGYEDKIRLHKNELDLALWFLFEKIASNTVITGSN